MAARAFITRVDYEIYAMGLCHCKTAFHVINMLNPIKRKLSCILPDRCDLLSNKLDKHVYHVYEQTLQLMLRKL